jgi:UDP-N-acetylmuramoylalanine--D-glutamate ligase
LIGKKKYSHHVVELSSFQLEAIFDFNPKISIWLNLSKDHLDRYKSLKDYISAKKNILSIGSKNINLISLDDKYSSKIFNDNGIKNKISFSVKNADANIYYKEGYIIDRYFSKNNKYRISNISIDLKNHYNLQNILAAYIVCRFLKIPINFFNNSIKNFKGLPYRSSVVYHSNTKLIINNSKATNISSALATLENQKNIYLILGGIAKEDGFNQFKKFKKNINKIYIYGKSRSLINNQINLLKISIIFKNLSQVINCVWKDVSMCDEKSTIIFAPACASFDQFKNFEERGSYFNQLILNKIK